MSNISKTINFKENLFRISILRATNFTKRSNLYDPRLTYQYSALFSRKYVFRKISSDFYRIWIEYVGMDSRCPNYPLSRIFQPPQKSPPDLSPPREIHPWIFHSLGFFTPWESSPGDFPYWGCKHLKKPNHLFSASSINEVFEPCRVASLRFLPCGAVSLHS